EAALWALSQELLAQGQSVILEWGHWGRAERDQKRLRARALGVGVELHYLDVPLEALIARVERRNATGEWTASPITRAVQRYRFGHVGGRGSWRGPRRHAAAAAGAAFGR